MRVQDLLAANLERNLAIVQTTLADFTEADMLVRPTPAANHAAWQLGHLIASESWFVSMAGGKPADLPAGFAERFNGKTTSVDDPAKLASKSELVALLACVRSASIAWVRGLAEADLAKPGPERIRQFAPTIGDMPLGIIVHTTMHLGQIQVIRRKLGKPVLF